MARARITDDGRIVELDLHGTFVDDAMELIRRAARLASGRGRATLRVVHGSSTSDPRASNRTIKHALKGMLEVGELREWVTDAFAYDGHTLLALAAGAPDARRLGMSDLRATDRR